MKCIRSTVCIYTLSDKNQKNLENSNCLLVVADSMLKTEEINFLIKALELMASKNCNLLLDGSSVKNFAEFLQLASLNKNLYEHVYILSKQRIENCPFQQIVINNTNATKDLSGLFKPLLIRLKIRLSCLILKSRKTPELVSILDFFSQGSEQVLVIPASPFELEYSGNSLALKEGGVPIFDPGEIYRLAFL